MAGGGYPTAAQPTQIQKRDTFPPTATQWNWKKSGPLSAKIPMGRYVTRYLVGDPTEMVHPIWGVTSTISETNGLP